MRFPSRRRASYPCGPRRPARASSLAGFLLALLLAILLTIGGKLGAAPWVLVTEIQYNPPEGEEGEFIEIHGREPPRADLTGWSLEGEVRYRFPDGTLIRPGEYIVIARNIAAFRKSHPPSGRVLGPFTGKLDNKRGRITIRNAAGASVSEARWENGFPWPTLPDGTGHTLSLLDPLFDPSSARSWGASERPGGTPGSGNFSRAAAAGSLLVKGGEIWKYWPGFTPPDPSWRTVAYKPEKWSSGATGIGYGDGDDATDIPAMRGKFLTIYARKTFQVADPAALSRIILRIDWDDGFIAHLNGKEVARSNMGSDGSPAAHDQPAAGRHEAGVPAELDLGPASKLLQAGENLLAIEVHNDDIASSDLSLWAEIESRKTFEESRLQPRPFINEAVLAPTKKDAAEGSRNDPPGAGSPPEPFVEVYNAGTARVDLGGWHLTNDPRSPRKFKVRGPVPIEPNGFAVLGRKELGDEFGAEGDEGFLGLVSPEGNRFLDAIRLGAGGGDEPSGGKRPALPPASARGRFPDGGRKAAFLDPPTPGGPNRAPVLEDIVINEIQYNPLEKDEEYIELHNRGGKEVDAGGFRIAGGGRFTIPVGTKIPAGGFLVIARTPETLARKHAISREIVLGPLQGSLSNAGEEITLRDPRGNIADQVEYGDGAPWPPWADGSGSSLELIDPFLDNSLPGAWAASEDGPRAKWQTFTYAKDHRLFKNQHNLSEFQILLLGEGECLIDDFRLRGERDLVADGSFEKGGAPWLAEGTHERSGIHKGDAARGKACYRIVADGRGNGRHNNVSLAIPGGLNPGRRYQVSFRAKWIRGSQTLLTRSAGQGIARAHRLAPPAQLGTPGAENSTRVRDAGPVIAAPRQEPIAPSTTAAVNFSARISSRSGVAEAHIRYRMDGDTEWSESALADDGSGPDRVARDGIWSGKVPPLDAGQVEFYLHAKDASGKEGTYPAGAPARTALYAVGIIPSGKLPTYTVLVSQGEWAALEARPLLSNRLASATLVYGDSRIFHNVGLRRRGSPFTRPRGRNWRVVFGDDDLDGRGSLTLDGQNGDGTNLNERLTYWCLEQLHAPNVRQQYVYFRLHAREEGIYEDVEKIDGGFLASWFGGKDRAAEDGAIETDPGAKEKGGGPKAAAGGSAAVKPSRKGAAGSEAASGTGYLHKVDDYFELMASGGQDYDEADAVFISEDPEDYRWNFPPRANGPREDFLPLLKLLQGIDPRTSADKGFDDRIEKMIDVDEWLRVLAARTLAYDWDTLGLTRGKNSMLYFSSRDSRWRLLPWDCDLSWQGNNARGPIFSAKFPGTRRLLERPQNRRRFLGYLSYLAGTKLDPLTFEGVLGDLKAHCGAKTESFRDFARDRRSFVLSQIPQVELRLAEARRVERPKMHDVVRASGTAPVPALRLSLDGREGAVRFLDMERWTAEFPVGPEGGSLALEALDFGGGPVASIQVKVKARPNAPPLPAKEAAPPPPPIDLARKDGAASTASSGPPPEGASKGGIAAQGGEGTGLPRDGAGEKAAGEAPPDAAGRAGAGEGAKARKAAAEPDPAVAAAAKTDAPDPTAEAASRRPVRKARGSALSPEELAVLEAMEKSGARGEDGKDSGTDLEAEAREVPADGASGAEDTEEPGEDAKDLPADSARSAGVARIQPADPGEGGGWVYIIAGSIAGMGLLYGAIVALRKRARGAPREGAGPPRPAPGARAPGRTPPRPDAGRRDGGRAGATPVKRAPRASSSAPTTAVPAAVLSAIQALGSPRFEKAAHGLARLSAEPDIPALLDALEDSRRTPFQKIRRSAEGFTASPSDMPSEIRVRHIAMILLERALGRPQAAKPTRQDWEELWRRASGGKG